MTTKCMHISRFLALGLLAATLMLQSGCSDPIRSKIVGTWDMQKAGRLSERINQDDTPSGNGMSLVFKYNGTLQTNTQLGEIVRQKEGSWRMVSFDPESQKMELVCDLAGEEIETHIRFAEADLISLVPPNMAGTTAKLKFVRAK